MTDTERLNNWFVVSFGINKVLGFTPSSTNLRNIRNNVDGLIVRTSQSRKVVRSKHRHVTLMLLTVAFVFLILTLPNSIYFVLEQTYSFAVAPTTNDYADWLRYRRLKIVSVIMFQLTDLQHATNFYLYLLTSRKFRQALSKNFKEFFKKFCQTRSDRSWSKQSVIFSRTSGTGSVRKSRSASVIQNPNRSLNIECRCSEEILWRKKNEEEEKQNWNRRKRSFQLNFQMIPGCCSK